VPLVARTLHLSILFSNNGVLEVIHERCGNLLKKNEEWHPGFLSCQTGQKSYLSGYIKERVLQHNTLKYKRISTA
jgi:hypothetical protein